MRTATKINSKENENKERKPKNVFSFRLQAESMRVKAVA